MKFLSLATALLLPLTAFAAKKPVVDRFEQNNAKQLSTGKPIKLDDTSYAKLTAAPRDYYVAVLLTALEARFGCGLCQDFQPEWDLLAKSWSKGDKKGESRLVFGTIDFVDGKNTFQSVRMDLTERWMGQSLTCDTATTSDCTSIVALSPNYWTRCEA